MSDAWRARTQQYYDELYQSRGVAAQRRYPNEDLCRFVLGRFAELDPPARRALRLLEIGCGSGGNLWMLTWEGFRATGLDLCLDALRLVRATFAERGIRGSANLIAGDLLAAPFRSGSFDVVLDVLATHHVPWSSHPALYGEVARLLAPGGHFFSVHPSAASDAFGRSNDRRLDECTLEEIRRAESPYQHNPTFCFIERDRLEPLLASAGLDLESCERHGRTYRSGREYFENLVIVARKPGGRERTGA